MLFFNAKVKAQSELGVEQLHEQTIFSHNELNTLSVFLYNIALGLISFSVICSELFAKLLETNSTKSILE